ncbi:MAG: LacI family DNA-binding transcriptional regulator [Spirochaetota bacterium]
MGAKKASNKNATIQDVADKAEVSISTVSHVLNNTRHVELDRRERVLAAIEELGYKPNLLARGLRGAGSKTIGLIISDIREEFFAHLTKSIESVASTRGFLVILCDAEEDPQKEARYIEVLINRGVDGIILAPVDRGQPGFLPGKVGVPIVLVDRRIDGSSLDCVGIENALIAAEATRHLAGVGRRRIGFLCHEASISTMADRVAGFRSATAELGLGVDPEVLVLDSRGSGEAAKVRDWLGKLPGVDAVICGNANLCFTLLSALEELGLSVPKDVAIVSFDDHECFRFLRVPITAVIQPTELMGQTALEVLLSRIEGQGTEAGSAIALPARLIVRESCGSARKEVAMTGTSGSWSPQRLGLP